MTEYTTIRVTKELADELYERKGRELSYEDYIWRLLEQEETGKQDAVIESEETGREEETAVAHAEQAEETASSNKASETTPSRKINDRVAEAIDEVAEGWEDSESRMAQRRAAAEVVLQHAVETGEPVGKSSKIVEQARQEHPVTGQSDETFWRKNIRPVLKEYGEYNAGAHGYEVQELGADNDN